MQRLALLVLLLGLLGPGALRADHFTIKLQAQTGKEPRSAEASFPAPEKKPAVRAVLTADVGTAITVKWTLRNIDTTATVKDVLVHLFVVKQEKPDQQEVPKLTKDVVVESALNMDFRPQDKTEGEITFTISNAGSYLLRLELKGAAGKDGREPFAALDLLAR
jgi:hypothetical protein